MNLLDVAVLVVMIVGGIIGAHVGFIVRSLSWLGLAAGLAIGLHITPRLARSLIESPPGLRLLSISALLVGLALIGHTAGLFASAALRRRFTLGDGLSRADRVAGAVLGVLGGLAFLWLLAPALRSTPGMVARQARGSVFVAFVDEHAPRQPPAARLLGRLMGEAPYPLFDDGTSVGEPPTADAGPIVDSLVARSVVRVDGPACGFRIAGTGFAVTPRLVVTNAHVVAGESTTQVTTSDRRALAARVVVFDGRHDVAVLRVDHDVPPLQLGRVRLGTVASVLGHPHGGELRSTPALVARWIDKPRSDITRSTTIRTRIVGLAARLIPGDSGAPVVGADGRVQAMVFAVDPAAEAMAFALSPAELRPFIDRARTATSAVPTGACLG